MREKKPSLRQLSGNVELTELRKAIIRSTVWHVLNESSREFSLRLSSETFVIAILTSFSGDCLLCFRVVDSAGKIQLHFRLLVYI